MYNLKITVHTPNDQTKISLVFCLAEKEIAGVAKNGNDASP
jgi:hypothetical protein